MPPPKKVEKHSPSDVLATDKKPVQKWQLQTAKAQFSEVFRRARTEGPQYVSKAGKEEVVIVSKEVFEKLSEPKKKSLNLWEFFRNSPLVGSGIDLERRKDYPRKVEL